MSDDAIDRTLAELTPARLAAIIEDLSLTQPADQRDSVPMLSIMGALKGDTNFDGPSGWGTYIRLRQAIIDGVGNIAGMRFIDGDS